MKIAIIGGGLAGLATAYFLLETKRCEVTLYEQKSIGAGASGVCSGLLHPYPGLMAKRSKEADLGLVETNRLLDFASEFSKNTLVVRDGIFRESIDAAQKERLLSHTEAYADIEQVEETLFLIRSGMTVLTTNYLQALFLGLKKQGLEYQQKTVSALGDIKGFDHFVIAAGYGVHAFEECSAFRFKYLKGQILRMEGKPPFSRSHISKGYMANYGLEKEFELGSTYERQFNDTLPDIVKAKELLEHKLNLCPGATVKECRAGVRVASYHQYWPVIEKINFNTHLFTGLGSRGLLYHALYAKRLCAAILSESKSR